MKKITFIALIILSAVYGALAQNNSNENKNSQSCAKFYMGLSTGANNQASAFGFNLELPVNQSVTIGSGLGGGTWGTKSYIEVRYYFQPCFKGWAIGGGFTHNTGIFNMTLSLPDANGDHHNMDLEAKPMNNAFVAGYRFWKLGKNRNRLYVEAGYSIPLSSPQYIVKSGEPLTDEADWTVRSLSPGGVIAAVGFSFAL